MTTVSREFTVAVEAKNYEKVEHLLKFMPYESQWEKFILGTNTWQDECGEHYPLEESVIDWSPLVIVSLSLDSKMIDLVMTRWSSQKDLLSRTYSSLTDTRNYLSRLNCSEEPTSCNNKFTSYTPEVASHAKNLIRERMAIQNINHSFSSIDNESWVIFVKEKLALINETDELLNFYNDRISISIVPITKKLNFFTSIKTYSAHTIELLTLVQARSNELISKQGGKALDKSCGNLLNSTLFSIEHDKYGVSTKKYRELFFDLNPSAETSIPLITAIPIDVVIATPLISAQEKKEGVLNLIIDMIYGVISQVKSIYLNTLTFFRDVLESVISAFSDKKEPPIGLSS